MKMLRLVLAVTAIVLVFIVTSVARPRPPGVPYPEMTLKSWEFDFPDSVTAGGMGAPSFFRGLRYLSPRGTDAAKQSKIKKHKP